MESVMLLGVRVHMVPCILAQAIECLGVLDDHVGALGEG